jgi:hypothetical protein
LANGILGGVSFKTGFSIGAGFFGAGFLVRAGFLTGAGFGAGFFGAGLST